MIKELRVQNFKRFRDKTFAFRPAGISFLAGGNNSGKSSVLQALAVWEFCRTAIETEKGRAALETTHRGDPLSIGAETFSPIALPDFTHLWTNLQPKHGYKKGEANAGYTLRIECNWEHSVPIGPPSQHSLEFGLTLAHDRIYIKPIRSTVRSGTVIPRFAYLPPFAGITAREERLSPAAQKRLIGRGLAGAVLRNILLDLSKRSQDSLVRTLNGRKKLSGEERRQFYKSDPWHQLSDTLQRVFQCQLTVKSFIEFYHATVGVHLVRGKLEGANFAKFPGYTPRDIMVEGSGFLQWLSVYALAVDPDINVLLLDEPDAHLHPDLQGHLLGRLRSLARDNSKQVLFATHSTEILRQVEATDIFGLQVAGHGYLTTDNQRIGLFQGLGSEYAPRLDQLRLHKRVIFNEGPFDESILKIIAEKLGRPLPESLIFWQFIAEHPQRRSLFEQLREQIPGLRGMSLRDRDSLELGQVGADLIEHNHPDRNELRCRTWRRRHLENYLLVPSAIARAIGRQEAEVNQFLTDTWGLAVGGAYTASDCSAGLRDARGKEILHEGLGAKNGEAAKQSVEQAFNCTRHAIAQAMTPEEIPEDVRKIIDQIHTMCQV